MKLSVLCLILAALLLQGCATDKASSATQKPDQNSGYKAPDWSNVKPALAKDSDSTRPGKPATDGKTAEKLYDFLVSKGWKLDQGKKGDFREFDSEESYSFKNTLKIGFLAMRFDDAAKAQENFPRISQIYKNKWGRAVISKNFVIAVFGALQGINNPKVMALTDPEITKLQADLDEFTKS